MSAAILASSSTTSARMTSFWVTRAANGPHPAVRVALVRVALDGDELEILVVTDVDRGAVVPRHLDFVGGAFLGISLDCVGVATAGDPQRGRLGTVRLESGQLGIAVVESARGAGDRRATQCQSECV